jgi:hypothetical protein
MEDSMSVKLTPMELEVLTAIYHSDYYDGGDALTTYVWSNYDYFNLKLVTPKQYRGVVSSLVQKELIHVQEYEVNEKIACLQKPALAVLQEHGVVLREVDIKNAA